MFKRIVAATVVVSFALSLMHPIQAWAQRGKISLIRDAEIENTIRTYAAPIFDAAGLNPDAVSVHLVNSEDLNAFVAGGQRLFVFTGLILRSETPNQLIGVIAHETGHIAGGHLARTRDALANATTANILTMVLGAAVIAAGGGGAGAAIMAGGSSVAQKTFLQYSRTQESAADQAALTYLDRTGQSGRGLVEFLDILGSQEALMTSNQDPYARSHPISRERIATLENRVENSPHYSEKSPEQYELLYNRMKAKLFGFIEPLEATLKAYPDSDQSVPARYARAIGYFQAAKREPAIAEIDSLLADAPEDPYFHELKGQILFEMGQVQAALPWLRKAVSLAPNEPLIRTLLGQAQIESQDAEQYREAIANLEEALRYDRTLTVAWRYLAIAYGRNGNLGQSALASAEASYLSGNKREALSFAKRAADRLPEGSPGHIRANDIIDLARKDKDNS